MDGVDCGNEEVWGFFHSRTHADRLDDGLWSRDRDVGLDSRCQKRGFGHCQQAACTGRDISAEGSIVPLK